MATESGITVGIKLIGQCRPKLGVSRQTIYRALELLQQRLKREGRLKFSRIFVTNALLGAMQ
jgi:hypothetical protein